MRAMANAPGGDALLAELKAVDAASPLYGTMRLVSGARRGPPPPGGDWIGADPAPRLSLPTGQRVTSGGQSIREDSSSAAATDRTGARSAQGPPHGGKQRREE